MLTKLHGEMLEELARAPVNTQPAAQSAVQQPLPADKAGDIVVGRFSLQSPIKGTPIAYLDNGQMVVAYAVQAKGEIASDPYTAPIAAPVPLTPAEVHGMAEAHGIDGEARHWFVIGITDSEKRHGIKKGGAA
jgi:hypothetical protein